MTPHPLVKNVNANLLRAFVKFHTISFITWLL